MRSSERPTILSWLGFSSYPNYAVSKPLGRLFGCIVILLFILALAAGLSTLARVFATSTDGQSSFGASALIVAVLGSPFVIWRAYTAHRAVDFQKEGLITDRISKAVEQLGSEKKTEKIGRVIEVSNSEDPAAESSSDTRIEWLHETLHLKEFERIAARKDWSVFASTSANLEVRVGALLSLERIAQNSVIYGEGSDHIRVMEIIAAYLRNNSRRACDDQTGARNGMFRTDLQVALDIIGRRGQAQLEFEKNKRYRLNLQFCTFDHASFNGGDFSNAIMIDSYFYGAKFHDAVLKDTWFARGLFENCDFSKARLYRTHFPKCTFLGQSGADSSTPFSGRIESILLHGARLPSLDPSCLNRHPHKVFGSIDTVLGSSAHQLQADFIELQVQRYDVQSRQVSPPAGSLIEAPVAYWSPFDADDAITDAYRDDFLNLPFNRNT